MKSLHTPLILLALLFSALLPASASADIDIRTFFPARDYTGESRHYSVATTEKMQRAKLLFVEDADGNILYRNIPMLIEGGTFATTADAITLPRTGDYRFRLGLGRRDAEIVDTSGDVSLDGETFFFTVTVASAPAGGGLRDIRLSKPPYYANQSLEGEAFFDVPPASVTMELIRSGQSLTSNIVHNSGGSHVVAYLTPKLFGHHEVVVTFERAGDGVSQRESIPIYVDIYERSGDLVIDGGSSGGGGGCSAVSGVAVLIAICFSGTVFAYIK